MQSLAFVITLPLFIVIVMFIVQVSQLMIGIMMVHYSAYTAARSASVWLPARVEGVDEQAVLDGYRSNNQNLMDIDAFQEVGDQFYLFPSENSYKYSQIRTAAVLSCAPISPSRDLGLGTAGLNPASRRALEATQRMYSTLVPSSTSNGRINPRLANKIAYSDRNTFVIVSWRDAKNGGGSRETYRSPTFNPRNHPNPNVHWVPGEVGWQDAITVHVLHRFALLPGPGRLLAKHLVPSSGIPDNVSSRILTDRENYSEPVYSVIIPASATTTSEGMKSVRPYNQEVRR
ncbi:MAG: hypothetical protein Tsb009_29530 [Planctomycetaceae bacterium]